MSQSYQNSASTHHRFNLCTYYVHDCVIQLRFIGVNTGARTPAMITHLAYTGLSVVTYYWKYRWIWRKSTIQRSVHGFNIFVTINPVILRKCWRNFLKIEMHFLWWIKKLSWRAKEDWKHDIVYDTKRSQSHWRSTWPTLWPQRSQWPLWSVWPSLWPKKVTGSLEFAVAYFMTPKVTVTFVVGLT